MKKIVAVLILTLMILSIACIKITQANVLGVENTSGQQGTNKEDGETKQSSNPEITKNLLNPENLIGTWMLLLPEGGYSNTEYLTIKKEDNNYTLKGKHQKSIFDGKLEFVDKDVFFNDPINGKFSIGVVESIEPIRNNAISLSLINEYEDILFGFYQKIEVLKALEE